MWSSAAGASRRRLRGRMATPRQRRHGHDPTNPPFRGISSPVTGMALYFLTPFPEDNIFLRGMAIRSAPAFIFFKYSYTLFLYTTPYIAYSILLAASTFSLSRQAARFAQANCLSILLSRKRSEL